MKALTTLQLDCILLICFRRNNGSELERHFQIKKYYVRASSSKDHENTRKWFFMVLLCFFSQYIYMYVTYIWMNERCMYSKEENSMFGFGFLKRNLCYFLYICSGRCSDIIHLRPLYPQITNMKWYDRHHLQYLCSLWYINTALLKECTIIHSLCLMMEINVM